VSNHQNLTFQAKFEQGQLYVTDCSPDLPPFSGQTHLIGYLRLLSLSHFQVKSMTFEGFDLTVEMERIDQEGKTPQYLVQVLAHTLASLEMSAAMYAAQMKKNLQAIHDEFAENSRKKGWSQLAISKPLVDISGGLFVISICTDQ
jgi:hypothetical protein